MSQVTTVQVEDFKQSHGEGKKGPWTRYAIKDGNGDWYSTFEKGVVDEGMKGQRVEVEYEIDGDYKNLVRATPQEPKPEPGTGNYIKGKEAPETQRSIHASVALEQAVLTAQLPTDIPFKSWESVLGVANQYYKWLRDRAEGKALAGTPTTTPSSDESVPV